MARPRSKILYPASMDDRAIRQLLVNPDGTLIAVSLAKRNKEIADRFRFVLVYPHCT